MCFNTRPAIPIASPSQSPSRLGCRWQGYLPVEGLCSRWQATEDDAHRRRIPAPLHAPFPAAWIRPDSLFSLPRKPAPESCRARSPLPQLDRRRAPRGVCSETATRWCDASALCGIRWRRTRRAGAVSAPSPGAGGPFLERCPVPTAGPPSRTSRSVSARSPPVAVGDGRPCDGGPRAGIRAAGPNGALVHGGYLVDGSAVSCACWRAAIPTCARQRVWAMQMLGRKFSPAQATPLWTLRRVAQHQQYCSANRGYG
jgi:hypothetical protein